MRNIEKTYSYIKLSPHILSLCNSAFFFSGPNKKYLDQKLRLFWSASLFHQAITIVESELSRCKICLHAYSLCYIKDSRFTSYHCQSSRLLHVTLSADEHSTPSVYSYSGQGSVVLDVAF